MPLIRVDIFPAHRLRSPLNARFVEPKHHIAMTTLERLKDLLFKQYAIDGALIKTDTPFKSLFESLGLDSLDIVDVFYSIEKEFNIKIPTQNLSLNSIQDLVDLVERTVQEQHPQPPPNITPQ